MHPGLLIPAIVVLSQFGVIWLLAAAPAVAIVRDLVRYANARLADPPGPAGVLPGEKVRGAGRQRRDAGPVRLPGSRAVGPGASRRREPGSRTAASRHRRRQAACSLGGAQSRRRDPPAPARPGPDPRPRRLRQPPARPGARPTTATQRSTQP